MMNKRSGISKTSTIAMIATAVMLLGVFAFPLWVITLQAPQYPQGLGLHIWVNKIDGAAPHDLQNINGLNHYIGMKAIKPGEIPELRFMQYFVIGLAALAAGAAAIRRRWALYTWVILAVSLSGLGLYDFYRWGYDYGHNLDPSAAIKIAGMSYQPPLFGSKQLLNFTATAWPGVGGFLAMLGVGTAALAAGYELVIRGRRRARPAQPATGFGTRKAAMISAAVLLVTVACSREPQPISFGTDTCAHCEMTISNVRYGAAIVTTKGRTIKFDSIECMVESQLPGERFADSAVHAAYVVTYESRGVFREASRVTYLVSDGMPSPMGANLTAFAAREDAAHVQHVRSGELLDWDGVKAYIQGRHQT